MINEIVYDVYKSDGCFTTTVEGKILCKIIASHLNSDDIKKASQRHAASKNINSCELTNTKNEIEIIKTSHADDEIVNEPEDEAGSPKYIDSGNVSPESLQMTISREDSRLSNLTPTIAYSPESFLIEEEDN